MSNLTLYNITNKFVDLMDKAQNGELTEEEYNKLGEEIALELQNKSAGIVGYVQERQALIDAIDTQIKRLKNLKEIEQKKTERFKEYVKNNMERLELQKLETELGTLTIAKNPESIEIIDESLIPKEFMKETIKIEPDKTKIKNYIKENKVILAGVRVINDKTHLNIK